MGLGKKAYFPVGKAKSGVDVLPALLPSSDAAKVFEPRNETYSVTHQPRIVTLAAIPEIKKPA